MVLFHLSNSKFTKLTPQPPAGTRGSGAPCVWLTNDPRGTRQDQNGNHAAYQHEVHVDFKDPYLFFDEEFEAFCLQGNPNPSILARWYMYLRPIEVSTVRAWNATNGTYV